ncbi:MAG: sigma-70 family RNA polymerase sigma factor [Bacteroidales bacterium]|nr:sigma-70 family RNA polymerase sigma factor [Bacteroidales bacterium]
MGLSQTIDYLSLWNKFIKDGNQTALSIIYMDYYDVLFNYGSKYTKDTQIIEDSIQNIFSNFLKVRKNLGEVHNLSGYILISFRRQLFLDIKNHKKLFLPENLSDDHFNYFADQEQDITDREENDRINMIVKRCIRNLTPKQQEIIYLHFECELSYEDLSGMFDITVESCYKTVYRSIKLIREEAEKILFRVRNN